MNSFVEIIIVLTLTVIGISSTRATVIQMSAAHAPSCSQIRRCVFQTDNGVIDLSSFENMIPVKADGPRGGSFQFNPCKAFSCAFGYALLCTLPPDNAPDILVDNSISPTCVKNRRPKDSFALRYLEDSNQVTVTLKCTSRGKPTLKYNKVSSNETIYNFVLSSPDVCVKRRPTTPTAPTNATATTMTTNTTITTMPTKTTVTTMPTNTTITTMPTKTTVTTMPTNTTITTMPTKTTVTTMPTNTTITTMPTKTTVTTMPTNTTATTSPTNTTLTTLTTNMTATTKNGTAMSTTTVITTTGSSRSTPPSHSTTPQKASSIQPIGSFVVLTAFIVFLRHGIQA